MLHLWWCKNPTVDPKKYKLIQKCLCHGYDGGHKNVFTFVRTHWIGLLDAFVICKLHLNEVGETLKNVVNSFSCDSHISCVYILGSVFRNTLKMGELCNNFFW